MPLDDLSAEFRGYREALVARVDGDALLDEVLGSHPDGDISSPVPAREAGGAVPPGSASPADAGDLAGRVAADIGEGVVELPVQT